MVHIERMRIMITVKAAPEPSSSYGDTVCVAGVRVDTDPYTWVRLYPVPFRHLASSQQFSKYDVLEVDTLPAHRDSRRESRRPIWDSLRVVQRQLSPDARARVLGSLPHVTMCELIAAVHDDPDAPSLGLVRVRRLERLAIRDHPGWSAAQRRAIARAVEQVSLFDADQADVPPLIAPRHLLGIHYRCEAADCQGHSPTLLDFELSALQHHHRNATRAALEKMIRTKFGSEQFNETQRTSLFVGNMAAPPKRRSFSALGIYREPIVAAWGETLF